MKPYEQATDTLGTADSLDQIRMNPNERRAARAALRQGELIASVLIRVNEDLGRVFGLMVRGIRALTRRSKVSAATPEWRLP